MGWIARLPPKNEEALGPAAGGFAFSQMKPNCGNDVLGASLRGLLIRRQSNLKSRPLA
jgi:hypothetical protein